MAMYKTFDGKRYRVYDEYSNKNEAKRDAAKFRAKGYLARIVYSKWASLHILYIRKKTGKMPKYPRP